MKKFLSVICIMAMLLSLVGSAAGAEAETNKYEKRLKYTVAWMAPEKFDSDILLQSILDKFNIEVEWVPMGWDNWEEKNRIWVASGDMPDVSRWNFNGGDYINWVNQGALRALPSDMSRWPNLQAIKDRVTVDEYMEKIDGQMHAWPNEVAANKVNNIGMNMILYRRDWANKLGYNHDKFVNVMEWDEFLQMCIDFAQKDPSGNGPGKTFGYANTLVTPRGLMKTMTPSYRMISLIDGEYKWGAAMPETLQALKDLRATYLQGGIWRDFYTSKDPEDAKDLFFSGQLGVLEDRGTIFLVSQVVNNFKKENPDLDPEETLGLIALKGPEGTCGSTSESEFWSTTIFNPSLDDERMNRWLDMIDWIASEEGLMSCNFGIKGKDWDIVDGKFECYWATNENGDRVAPENEALSFYYLAKCEGDMDYVEGNPFIPEFVREGMIEQLSTMESIGTRLATEGDYNKLFCQGKTYLKYGEFFNETDDEVVKIIASSEDVEADWNAYLQSKQQYVDQIIQELNATLK